MAGKPALPLAKVRWDYGNVESPVEAETLERPNTLANVAQPPKKPLKAPLPIFEDNHVVVDGPNRSGEPLSADIMNLILWNLEVIAFPKPYKNPRVTTAFDSSTRLYRARIVRYERDVGEESGYMDVIVEGREMLTSKEALGSLLHQVETEAGKVFALRTRIHERSKRDAEMRIVETQSCPIYDTGLADDTPEPRSMYASAMLGDYGDVAAQPSSEHGKPNVNIPAREEQTRAHAHPGYECEPVNEQLATQERMTYSKVASNARKSPNAWKLSPAPAPSGMNSSTYANATRDAPFLDLVKASLRDMSKGAPLNDVSNAKWSDAAPPKSNGNHREPREYGQRRGSSSNHRHGGPRSGRAGF